MNGRSSRPIGRLWKHRDFRRLWAAQAISAFGSRITRTALPIIAIKGLGASPSDVSILSALSVAPGVVVGLFGGGMIDRARKRPVLIAMDLLRAALLLTLPLAAIFGVLSIWQLWIVAALAGAATSTFQMADSAFLPRLVGRKYVVDGNTKLTTTESIAEIGGPGIAGILIQLVTAPIAIVVDALTFIWSALWLWRVRTKESVAPASDVAEHPLSDIRLGLRACAREPAVFAILTADTIRSYFGGFFFALYMIFTLTTLGLSEATVGLIIGVGGIGALAGTFIAGYAARIFGQGGGLMLCYGLGNAGTLFLPLAWGQGDLTIPFLVLQQLIGDAFLVAYAILSVSMRQVLLPLDVQARGAAAFHVAEGVALPLGALTAGAVAEMTSPGIGLWIAILGGFIPLFAFARARLWTIREAIATRAPA